MVKLKPEHLRPLCPMCGAHGPRWCKLRQECGCTCPWVESGQHERDCASDDEETSDA